MRERERERVQQPAQLLYSWSLISLEIFFSRRWGQCVLLVPYKLSSYQTKIKLKCTLCIRI
ncbi:LOW QUALITY PROTEIN: hypothetical protein TorRG33x02_283060 [Trema orientale]|uniref:Uncharacterized protein n=1 Tax=Trema orientale TaxID=63057 RepID=A0A2P5CIW6_TREOI|nr:LOW QUALITY PROTEIN: hypothetical protein TorRG33x02_283060 [Trema orientale]